MNEESGNDKDKTFDSWIKGLGSNELTLWKEAMAQLRQLHADVWNGVRFFLTVNGIVAAAIFAVLPAYFNEEIQTPFLTGILAGIGLILTSFAIKILGKHRDYYLAMLLRKTLLEKELGFYDSVVHNVNLSFPWSVDAKYVNELVSDPTKWKSKQKYRVGTITVLLASTYWLFLGAYIIALIVVGLLIGCNTMEWELQNVLPWFPIFGSC